MWQQNVPTSFYVWGDDHGWDETGYNGHPHLQTPILDEMAATGLRLDHFYSAHPTCSPTRGSVITGRHPNRYGTFTPNCSIRPEEISIAQLLAKEGYQCGHFGKWHLGPVKASSPTNPGAMGFHEWLSHDNFFELDPVLSHNGAPPKKIPGESSEIIVDRAIQFIDQAHHDEKPFFAVIWFGSPHEPYSGLERDLALYDNLPDEYASKSVRLTSNETGRSTTRQLKDVLRERYAEITAMDRSMGQLRDWLSEESLRDNTIVWYCGDNGTSTDGIVTSPFRGRKGNMYEGGIRVPGIIEWPAKIAKPRSSEVVSVTSDIFPTLCDLLDIKLPSRPLDGISLEPLIAGKMDQRPEPVCFWSFKQRSPRGKPYIAADLQQGTTPLVKKIGDQFTRTFQNHHYPEVQETDLGGERAIVDNEFKLVLNEKKDGLKRELFNLHDDPAEETNLLEQHSDRADRMQKQLLDWQYSVLNSLTEADYQ